MQSYTFPFDTCEKATTSALAQPWSVFFNCISLGVISYFLIKSIRSQQFNTIPLFLSLFAFEAWHTFSHVRHVPGNIQVRVVHGLAYAVSASVLIALCRFSPPSTWLLAILGGLVLFDIFAFANLPVVFYIASQLAIVVTILIWYYPLLEKQKQGTIHKFVLVIFIIILAFVNESANCNAMMDHFNFPYHALIEAVGVYAFYLLAKIFHP
jgi:hypothetical protein